MMLEKFKSFDKQTKIIAVATLLCIVVTCIMGANTVKYNLQKKISVTAKITMMEEYVDTSGEFNESKYKVYVNYSCLGKIYKDVYYTDVPFDTELAEGDKVNIEVYADNPGEIASDTFVSLWFFLAGSVVLSVISVRKIKEELSHGNAEN